MRVCAGGGGGEVELWCGFFGGTGVGKGGCGGLLMGSEEFMWLGKGTEGRWGRILRSGFGKDAWEYKCSVCFEFLRKAVGLERQC